MPLWARAICAKQQPDFFPDLDAQRILDELNAPVPKGLFYYFRRSQVQALVCELAKRYPGGALAFDATCAKGLKGVNKEVELSGIKADSFFSLEDPKAEMESLGANLSVSEKDYFLGYVDPKSYHRTPLTVIVQHLMHAMHLGFIVHVDFA